jgi:hypothetical protein
VECLEDVEKLFQTDIFKFVNNKMPPWPSSVRNNPLFINQKSKLESEIQAFIRNKNNLPQTIKNNLTRHLEGVTNRPDLVNFYRKQFEKTEKQYENFLQLKSEIQALLKQNPPQKITANLEIQLQGMKKYPYIVNFYRPQFETTKKQYENFLKSKPKGHKQLLKNMQTHKLPIYLIKAHGSETGQIFTLGDNQWVIFNAPSKCHTYSGKTNDIYKIFKSTKYLFSTIAPYEIKGPGSSFYDLGLTTHYILRNNVKIKNRPTTLSSFINGKPGVFVVGACRVPRVNNSLPKSEQMCRYGYCSQNHNNASVYKKNRHGVRLKNVINMRTLKNMNLARMYGYWALNNRNWELERFMQRPNSELSNQEMEWKRTKGRTLFDSLIRRREAARKIQSSFRKYKNLPKETKNDKKALRRERREAASKILENMNAKGGCFGRLCRSKKVVPI